MLKTLAALSATCCFAMPSSADTIIGLYGGAGQWQSDYSGEAGSVAVSLEDLNIRDESNNVFYIALEHPIPLLPNIKVQQVSLDTAATSTLSEGFVFDELAFPAGTEVVTKLDLSHSDATLYYEILDNWVNLDLGLTLRAFDGEASVSSIDAGLTETVELDAIIPMAYGKAQFDLPLTGWSVSASANLVSYDGNELSDYSAALAYDSDVLIVFDVGVEIGYRAMTLKLEEDLDTDIELEGPYASVTFHF
jgi:outer membrane protein